MHHNGGADGTSAGGVVAFSRPKDEKSGAYAEAIYNAVIAAGGLRGNRATPLQTTTNFQTFREADMPAVLMEYGFMDSKVDTPVIVTEAYSVLVAYATMEGIAKAAGLKKKPEEAPAEPEEPDRIYRVQVGAYKVKANAEAMLKKLEAAGFEGFIVSRFASEVAPAPKSIDELAQEVIDGKHGSGDARRESLGEQYEAVQTRVNELLKK
jgi:N-acetylmuramoyl-L-alanine amidase